MRSVPSLLAVLAITATGAALRDLSPFDQQRAPLVQGNIADATGEVRGRLVRSPGCPGAVWVAEIPGYLTAVSPRDVDWGMGPSVAAYAFAGRPVSARWSRAVSLVARAGELSVRAVGLAWPWGGLSKAMAPASCPGAARRALAVP